MPLRSPAAPAQCLILPPQLSMCWWRSGGQKFRPLTQSQNFVHLQAQSPLRVLQAIFRSCNRVCGDIVSIHGLEEEVLEGQSGEALRIDAGLREDQFQFVAFDRL